jgi:hypothetical protein
MMTHDPFQNYQAFSPYSGLPYPAFQPFVNPIAAQLSNPGIGGYGIYPQPVQGAGLLGAGFAGQQAYGQPVPALNPLVQHPLVQHALLQGSWHNPLLAANLQNQLLNPIPANYGWPQQQQQPFPYPLAPQSLIGGGAIGLPFGQISPLAHPALRQAGYGYF